MDCIVRIIRIDSKVVFTYDLFNSMCTEKNIVTVLFTVSWGKCLKNPLQHLFCLDAKGSNVLLRWAVAAILSGFVGHCLLSLVFCRVLIKHVSHEVMFPQLQVWDLIFILNF